MNGISPAVTFLQERHPERMETMDGPFAANPGRPLKRLPRERAVSLWKDYLSLTKPGITISNSFACLVGYWLASGGRPEWLTLLWTLLGTALVMGGSCALNNGIDWDYDRKMDRTKNRPVPSGRISFTEAFILGFVLTGAGVFLLYTGVNSLTGWMGAAGFFLYVGVYTLWLKRVSASNTVVGSLSGAVPPLIGWGAADPGLSWPAWILFAILFLWQPPHFYALAMLKKEDYRKAGIPMLPVVKGNRATRRQMLFFVTLLFPVSLLLEGTGTVGRGYTVTALVLGMVYLALSVRKTTGGEETRWARWMFRYSLIYLTLILAAMAVFALPLP